MTTVTREELDLAKLREELCDLRDFPNNTTPASRHLETMADALAAGERYAMFEEEPEHCAVTMYSVLIGYYGARCSKGNGEAVPVAFDPTNHHNALKCPYCNPEGLQFAHPAASAAEGEKALRDYEHGYGVGYEHGVKKMESEMTRLRTACGDIDADFMTSEGHHPGYVLIPTQKFESIRTALTTPAPEAPAPREPSFAEKIKAADAASPVASFTNGEDMMLAWLNSNAPDRTDGSMLRAATGDGQNNAAAVGLAPATATNSAPRDPLAAEYELATPPHYRPDAADEEDCPPRSDAGSASAIDAGLAKTLTDNAAYVREIRSAVIEECAKVAEALQRFDRNADKNYAMAIRSLASPDQGRPA